MVRYIVVSVAGGMLFGFMDGLVNANPLAQKLFSVYKPIARQGINVPTGVAIDLFYGFAMAGIFLLLRDSLPGQTAVLKGLSFALIAWFFRVAMYAASHWMMFNISTGVAAYILSAGLVEMAVLGVLYGLTLK